MENNSVAPDTTNITAEQKPKSAFSSLDLRWKRKHWFCMMLFNLTMVILMGIDVILRSRLGQGTYSIDKRLIFTSICLPICLTLAVYYIWTALREYNLLNTIIKRERIRYFSWGMYCSCMSFIICTLQLILSITKESEDVVKTVFYVSLSICFLLGIASSAFTSIYEFCACWDVFYHKNKEILIKEHLDRQKAQEQAQNLKIIESAEEDEEETEW